MLKYTDLIEAISKEISTLETTEMASYRQAEKKQDLLLGQTFRFVIRLQKESFERIKNNLENMNGA